VKALISDIHGNLEALTAVLKDIDAQNADEICFLGDVVGYGPDPEACIDLVQERCKVQLMGNHDYAMLNAPVGVNKVAAGAIVCLRSRMEPGTYSMSWKRRRWKFLEELHLRCTEGTMLFVHASPRDPVMEYVLPSDPLYHPEKCASIFERVERFAFCGHTHFPGVMTPEPRFQTPDELGGKYIFGEEKAVINLGSVGQPRDRDPRACYALLGDDKVEWRRIEYDYNKTIEKIKANSCLDDRAGLRLAEGK